MKKTNIIYVVLGLLLVGYLIYNQYSNNTNTSSLVYKPSFTSDCANVENKPNKKVIMTNEIKNQELVKTANSSDYQKSACVQQTSYILENYMVLDDYKIEHQAQQNSQAYQLSYEKTLLLLKNKTNKSTLDKKIEEALKYYTESIDYKTFLADRLTNKDDFQANEALIGPKPDDKAGVYHLVISIKIVKNDIYKLKNNTKSLDKTEYLFDGLKMNYVRIGA